VPAARRASGQHEQRSIEEDRERRRPARVVEHEVLRIGHDRHVRAEDAPERLVEPRQQSPQVRQRRLAPALDLHDPHRLGVAERPRPQGALAAASGTSAQASSRRLPREREHEPETRRRHGARGHEVRPKREPREQAEQEERAARGGSVRIREAPAGARGAEQDQPESSSVVG
jgi:hypothetical protein